MPSNQPFNFRKRFQRLGGRSLPHIHLATLLVVAGVGLFLAFGVSWLLGNEVIVRWAAAVQAVQQEPPWFVSVPEPPHRPLLLGIFAVLLAIVLAITTFFPKPNPWTRGIIVGIIIALLIRYIFWRVLATLNFNGPWNGLFALALVILEIPLTIPGLLMLFWLPGIRDRTQEANRYEALVKAGDYQPTVDILIPTYNEPERIVRRTIIGCQAVDYPHRVIYVLDDGDRPAIAQLALELGCKYLTRSDRRHAKAGNLNQALQYSQGELVAVFDADFVPTRNFLWRTVGFFSQDDIGLVQSHQNFYNPDPIVRNLGLAKYMTVSREDFSRKGQPTLDSIGATICDGSAFVVRRRDLDKIGGFVTESITEDYFSGVMIAACRQRVIYLDENLSAGLAAESLADYMSQHHRWLTGNLQGFFIPANPLSVPGLSWRQRLGHLVSLSFWLS
ncbi:MAG: glycosyltransferase [Chloroflexaceae bacterium]|nr:glycosyltransferase [Chloroflexaceae bacterium]